MIKYGPVAGRGGRARRRGLLHDSRRDERHPRQPAADVPRGGPRERFRWNFESPVESRYAGHFWTVVDAKGRRVANQWLYFNAYQMKYGIRESMRRGWNGSSYSLSQEVRLLPDGWTVVTRDRSLSAQWEHTIAVTEDGYDVLTRLPGDDL